VTEEGNISIQVKRRGKSNDRKYDNTAHVTAGV